MRKYLKTILLCILVFSSFSRTGALPGLDFYVRIWGGDLAIRWPIPAKDPHATTELLTFLGGGSEKASFYREFPDGNLPGVHSDSVDPGYTPEYTNVNIAGGVGLRRHLSLGGYRLVLTGIVRSRFESHSFPEDSISLASDSLIPDSSKLVENTLQAAWKLDKIAAVPLPLTSLPLDSILEGNLAWSPALGFRNEAGYLRLNTMLRSYLQLLNRRSVRMYLASRIGVDYLIGATIPMYALSSVGEINDPLYLPIPALGGIIRGIDAGRFNGTLKLYSNFEYRVKIATKPKLDPILRLFLDAGLSGYPEMESLTDFPMQITLGTSVSLDIMGFAELGYFVAWCPNETTTERKFGHGMILRSNF